MANEKSIEKETVLQLDKKEEELKNKILHYYKVHKETFLIELIKRADTGSLIKLALSDACIDQICKLPQLAEYWTNVWRLCGLNPREDAEKNNKPLHEYLPMPTVSSCFDLIKGYFLYENYRKLTSDACNKGQHLYLIENYLMDSAELGCYFAINELCSIGVNLLKEEFNEFIVVKMLHYARLAAQIYLAPGYLLLANVYQELIPFQEQQVLQTVNLRLEAFKSINIAKRLETISAPMINNAYQGQNLADASGGKLRSFTQAEQRLQNLLHLDYLELDLAIEHAKEEAQSIRKLYESSSLTEDPDNHITTFISKTGA
ncbi:DUF5630 domain-containing protein [Legionella gresilensis]|uniref:DUF5630 domain-containing protein n=1 Tax=Legionella gresilensis TaxID=91823 RepID=UPI0010416941|nr:DUF5630 domain-containing protein [Legionella gresilensis]